MQEVVELKNGAKKSVSKKMFPGYVLINMVMNDDTWYVVRNTRGVTGFVGPGSKPVPLTDMEMRPLGIKTENIEVDFAEGDDRSCHRRSLERYHRRDSGDESWQAERDHQC